MPVYRAGRRSPGATLSELLFLLLILGCALTGCVIGLPHGFLLGVAGFLAGIVAAVLIMLMVALIGTPWEWFWQWWRPYPPICENGTCRWFDYKSAEVPADLRAGTKGLSWLGHQCKCGNVYAGGYGYGYRNRWVRILPDGTLRPYLKHGFMGRWKADDGAGIGSGGIDEALDRLDKLDVPGWAIAALCATLLTGMALLGDPPKSMNKGWFAALCSAVGFVTGCVVWFVLCFKERRRQRNPP